ncbi:hypothetical protein NQ318_006853 [Aromia moschata]|uniref:Uncharacterized protein n=1 Tax=Aromia moschata TaxID=1265417 RepID=A0AAV8YHY4_9CUCU|nr:hypothetical protein NQ318_006853 [Aromia moschata]
METGRPYKIPRRLARVITCYPRRGNRSIMSVRKFFQRTSHHCLKDTIVGNRVKLCVGFTLKE